MPRAPARLRAALSPPRNTPPAAARCRPDASLAGEALHNLAAHDLANARRVPLTVVGVGSDSDWIRSLEEKSDVEVELIADPDIHSHVATDDVVGVGLVALEAARYCAAVVSASLDQDGCLDRALSGHPEHPSAFDAA